VHAFPRRCFLLPSSQTSTPVWRNPSPPSSGLTVCGQFVGSTRFWSSQVATLLPRRPSPTSCRSCKSFKQRVVARVAVSCKLRSACTRGRRKCASCNRSRSRVVSSKIFAVVDKLGSCVHYWVPPLVRPCSLQQSSSLRHRCRRHRFRCHRHDVGAARAVRAVVAAVIDVDLIAVVTIVGTFATMLSPPPPPPPPRSSLPCPIGLFPSRLDSHAVVTVFAPCVHQSHHHSVNECSRFGSQSVSSALASVQSSTIRSRRTVAAARVLQQPNNCPSSDWLPVIAFLVRIYGAVAALQVWRPAQLAGVARVSACRPRIPRCLR